MSNVLHRRRQHADSTAGNPAPPASPVGRGRAGIAAHAPQTACRVAVLLGLLSVVDALRPHEWRWLTTLTPIVPSPALAAARAVVGVSGLLLLRIAAGLRKRKRAEWRIAVAACVAICVATLLRREWRFGELAITVALLVTLVLARDRFTARADPRGRAFAGRVVAQVLTFTVGYGMVLLYLPDHVAESTSFWARLREVALSIAGAGGSLSITDDAYGDFVHATLLALGLLALVAGTLLALRPDEPIPCLSSQDEGRLRSLLERHGARDSLGYFALRRDKSVAWSATGKAAITYRVVCGVALVSGDPLGDPEAWPGAIAAVRTLVESNGWTPAVIGCSELGATVFAREWRLSALALGDEAILPVATFCLDGRAMRGVRQACTRVARAGYTVSARRAHDVGAGELDELRVSVDAWRDGAVERGYSMALSRVGDPADTDCVIVRAYLAGQLAGILHFVPWGERGISLDLMRRDRASDNGVNEFMIAELVRACPDLGVERISLNFAVFRDALERGERIGAGPVLRLWRRTLLMASRWWQIDSLYRFNAKFRPEWEPRFVCFPSARDLPRIAFAALEAEAFIVRPQRVKRLLGRAAA
ncbi:MAG: phosphatidylglycerol lysyltransferase domain-containing protein [Jatrophihabitantaceae bacterium]